MIQGNNYLHTWHNLLFISEKSVPPKPISHLYFFFSFRFLRNRFLNVLYLFFKTSLLNRFLGSQCHKTILFFFFLQKYNWECVFFFIFIWIYLFKFFVFCFLKLFFTLLFLIKKWTFLFIYLDFFKYFVWFLI